MIEIRKGARFRCQHCTRIALKAIKDMRFPASINIKSVKLGNRKVPKINDKIICCYCFADLSGQNVGYGDMWELNGH